MSRRRRNTPNASPRPGATPAEGAGSVSGFTPPASAPPSLPLAEAPIVNEVRGEVEVFALSPCIIAGVRRERYERFRIPAARKRDLTAGGLLLSERTASALWRTSRGRILAPEGIPSTVTAAPLTERPLRVLQLTHYDPGASVYRYHSAANATPGIVSALVRFGDTNPHCSHRQWDGYRDLAQVKALLLTADVIHCHMDLRCLFHDLRSSPLAHQRLARTYHGSVLPGDTTRRLVEHEVDRRNRAIVFGARPYHLRPGMDVPHWLPIPMPCADYATLAEGREPVSVRRPFRVAHSPTNRAIKGTEAFVAAIESLKAEGIAIEAVMIEGMEHGAALRLKATCDATFDSFFLGMQGSGLEAAAMGQPVLAGDPEAQRDLLKLGIPVPWTVADDAAQLRAQLHRLACEPGYAEAEARRVNAYVRSHHDYAIVGAKYRDILAAEVGPLPGVLA